MTISRTVSGLIIYEECDSEDGWIVVDGPLGGAAHGPDTSVKHSGSASSKMTGSGSMAPWSCLYKKCYFSEGNGRLLHIWHKMTNTARYVMAVTISDAVGGSRDPNPALHFAPTYDNAVPGPHYWDYESGPEDWIMHTKTLTDSDVWGTRWLCIHTAGIIGDSHVDKVAVAQNGTLTVGALTEGQKVELYRTSDNTKLGEATCGEDETTVTFDITTEDWPLQLYMKIYATNGTTLVETTLSYQMCGGDTWEWAADAGTMTLTSDNFIIYRSAAAATPKTASLTANLKTPAGANYPGALISFTASLGTVSPSFDTTDSNGNAETALTSSSKGLAVVKAQWLGDSNVPACSTYLTVHIFYEAEAEDSDKSFQFFVQGVEYDFVDGRYAINYDGKPEDFEVEVAEWNSDITFGGLVSIYRWGIKEFAGILLVSERTLSDAPRVVLSGPDQTWYLSDRVVDLVIYEDAAPEDIIADLLTDFASGITAGSLGATGVTMTITISTETLLAAIQRIGDLVCWQFRVNLNRTLDFAEHFSGSPSGAAFTEGQNILALEKQTDYRKVCNWVRMVGSGIVSTKQVGTNIMGSGLGLHQRGVFQSSIDNQATLDEAAQAYLDLNKESEEIVAAEVIDENDPGTFHPEDTVTITSDTLDVSGEYLVKRIARKMTDATWASLELSNRLAAYWELDETYRRMIKDVSL